MHDHARRQPRAPRHLDGRPLPERGRRQRSGLNQGVGAGFAPIHIPGSVSACTGSRGRRRARPAYMQNRRMGGLDRAWGPAAGHRRAAPATTTATRGDRSPGVAFGLPDFPSSSTRTTPTRWPSCPSSRRRALSRQRTAVGAEAATRGAGSRWAAEEAALPSCATMDIDRLKARVTSARPVSSGSGEGGSGTACSIPAPIHNARSRSCGYVKRSGQIRLPHQKRVDAAGGAAAFGDRPDDQRLAALHVAGGEHAGHARHPVLVAPHVAALGHLHAELIEHARCVRAENPIASRTRSAFSSNSLPGTGSNDIRPSLFTISTCTACSVVTRPSASPVKRSVEME